MVYDFKKKGQASQKEYKDVVNSNRKKNRKAKAQSEPDVATAFKR